MDSVPLHPKGEKFVKYGAKYPSNIVLDPTVTI
jgi:hypothetical protein